VVELLLAGDGGVRGTRVVHVQTQTQRRWPGWDGERLLDFIVTRAEAPDPR
jgi:hypothetical protein